MTESANLAGIEAVIFDWGGTLTPWHDIDFSGEAIALANAVRDPDPALADEYAARLRSAGEEIWGRSRDHQRSSRIADIFAAAGLPHDPAGLDAYANFWEPHTTTDPQVRPLWEWLRERGIKVGVLSNTIWPRQWHRRFFERDGVLDLIDGDIYSSEIPWTKPSSKAFHAAVDAVGGTTPERCVYVGDRLFDDIWGAQQAGMRTIHIPHSEIPSSQRGHSDGVPDSVAHQLHDIRGILDRWCAD